MSPRGTRRSSRIGRRFAVFSSSPSWPQTVHQDVANTSNPNRTAMNV